MKLVISVVDQHHQIIALEFHRIANTVKHHVSAGAGMLAGGVVGLTGGAVVGVAFVVGAFLSAHGAELFDDTAMLTGLVAPFVGTAYGVYKPASVARFGHIPVLRPYQDHSRLVKTVSLQRIPYDRWRIEFRQVYRFSTLFEISMPTDSSPLVGSATSQYLSIDHSWACAGNPFSDAAKLLVLQADGAGCMKYHVDDLVRIGLPPRAPSESPVHLHFMQDIYKKARAKILHFTGRGGYASSMRPDEEQELLPIWLRGQSHSAD